MEEKFVNYNEVVSKFKGCNPVAIEKLARYLEKKNQTVDEILNSAEKIDPKILYEFGYQYDCEEPGLTDEFYDSFQERFYDYITQFVPDEPEDEDEGEPEEKTASEKGQYCQDVLGKHYFHNAVLYDTTEKQIDLRELRVIDDIGLYVIENCINDWLYTENDLRVKAVFDHIPTREEVATIFFIQNDIIDPYFEIEKMLLFLKGE